MENYNLSFGKYLFVGIPVVKEVQYNRVMDTECYRCVYYRASSHSLVKKVMDTECYRCVYLRHCIFCAVYQLIEIFEEAVDCLEEFFFCTQEME
jgi:hypothetical protein